MTRRGLATGLGVATLVAGLLAVTGWIFDVAVIENLGPGQRAMSPLTAVTLGIASVSLLIQLGDPQRLL